LVTAAERILGDLGSHGARPQRSAQGAARRITISTHSAFAGNELPQLVRKFRESRPAIEVRIREGGRPRSSRTCAAACPTLASAHRLAARHADERAAAAGAALRVYPTTHAFATKKRGKVRLEDLREET
jgi:hypothetical protein